MHNLFESNEGIINSRPLTKAMATCSEATVAHDVLMVFALVCPGKNNPLYTCVFNVHFPAYWWKNTNRRTFFYMRFYSEKN
jgi:hypothetical protein